MPIRSNLLVVVFFAVLAAGCSKTPPPVTPANGVVLLNDMPLPKAQVEFVPDLAHFGAEMNSTAITDETGKFQLICNFKAQPGAVVGKHRVVITNAPLPADMRGMDERSQARASAFMRQLTNRPIPEEYGSVGRTTVVAEVTKDRSFYEIKLTR